MIEISKELSGQYQEVSRTSDQLEFTVKSSPDWSYFAGHFPNFPVLPAVGIIDFSQYFASKFLPVGTKASLASVQVLKVKKPITAGETLHIKAQKISDTVFSVEWKNNTNTGDVIADITLQLAPH